MVKKKVAKKVIAGVKDLTGDAAKRARARKLAKSKKDKAAKAKAKAAKEKKSTEKDMKYLMDSGQRQYDSASGMVMNKGGLAKKNKKK